MLEVLQAAAPGALPAGAIIWMWWKLDRRIFALELRLGLVPCQQNREGCER